jgi:uncharacterized protein (DUF433 family)
MMSWLVLKTGVFPGLNLRKVPSKKVRIMATDTTKNQSWVQKTPGVCGGRACIRNTRITVWGVVNSRRLGAADEQILENIRLHRQGQPHEGIISCIQDPRVHRQATDTAKPREA